MDEFNFNPSSRNSIRVSNAIIQDIAFDGNISYITITYNDCPGCWNQNQEQIIRLVVTDNTVIRNEAGRNIPVGSLQSGMIINAVFSSAMTRSITPQAQAFQIQIRNRPNMNPQTTGRILEVNTRNQTLLTMSDNNPSSIIRFNIAPNTVILDPLGRPIPFARLMPGLRVRIQHASFMTASIPPQTTAFRIQIIR